MKKLFKYVSYIGLVHEIFHYLAAKIFDVPVELHSCFVVHGLSKSEAKNIVIALSPFFISIIVLAVVLINCIYRGWDKGWIYPAIFYMGSSIWDIVDVINFARTGEWNRNYDG